MGTIQAYLAALFFHLIGPSLFTLRLAPLLLIAIFLTSMYLLTGVLYTNTALWLTCLPFYHLARPLSR